MPVVQVENLHKVYGHVVAVDDVSFEVQEGEIFGMVGPNGAGKTTTIECVEGLRRPDGGSISVLGLVPQADGYALRERIGMPLQEAALPLTYVVQLLQGLWFAEPWSEHLLKVAVLFGMLIVGVLVSAKTFRWE